MAVTPTPYGFELLLDRGRSHHIPSECCKFLDFLHSNRLRCVDGFLIEELISFGRQNNDKVSVWANSLSTVVSIDTPRQIAETPILSLRCVDALWGKGLRAVVASFAESIYTNSRGCVDLALETLTPSGLSDEHPTDWVKSD